MLSAKSRLLGLLLALGIVIVGLGLLLGLVVSDFFDSGIDPLIDACTNQKTMISALPKTHEPDSPWSVRSSAIDRVQTNILPVRKCDGGQAMIEELGINIHVEPDPHYETELHSAGLSTRGWKTDFSRHVVPFSEIKSGGVPRDAIAPLDRPRFTIAREAKAWLGDREPVIAFELDGVARAYPLHIMIWHEIVNDVVAGVPIAVTYCPLCNSAVIFERTLNGVVYDFGTSGYLRNSDLVMWDRQTETWWQQFNGEGIVGALAGNRLVLLHASIVSFQDFREVHPEGDILSRSTGFSRPYGQNPYVGYDDADKPPFFFTGEPDDRLLPMERVVTVTIGDVYLALPFSILRKKKVVEYTVNGQDLVVFFKFGTTSALNKSSILDSRDVGASGVFDPNFDGLYLTFQADGDTFVDVETGSVWNVLGQAVEGLMAGAHLEPIVHGNFFWFAWAAFNPDTLIYGVVD